MSDMIRSITNNRAAYHEYFVEDKFEAGIEL
ncbi:MAG: SsrA-binding protein, partial [Clostridia bacterium]|nr:SsrA-binding protein [Clostridia bacterium]